MIMDQALLQRRRRRARRRFCGFADLISGLSVDAPASLSFGVADQPISLFDYTAHNLISSSGDFTAGTWTTANGTTIVDADSLIDGSATLAGTVSTGALSVTGERMTFYCRVTQDAIASTTRFAVVQFIPSVGIASGLFVFIDTSDVTNIGYAQDYTACKDIVIEATDAGAYFEIYVSFTPPAGTTTMNVQWRPAFGALADLTNANLLDGYDGTITTTNGVDQLDVTRNQLQYASAPTTYTATTGSAVAPVASYGDIQFADSLYDAADDNYVVTLSITSGDLTLSGTTGLTFTSGDGTSDASMVFSGTLENINTALRGLAIENASAGSATLVYKIVSNANGAILTGNIPVTVTAVATFLLLSDGTSYLLLSDGTSKLKLSA